MQKIAIYGKATAGKTTLAEALYDNAKRSTLARFAGPLKEGLALMGITKEGTPELYRQAAQYIGTDIVRAHNDNWWVELLDRTYNLIRLTSTDDTRFLIDDVRFENELEWSEMNHFLTVKIDVSPETQKARGMTEERMNHPSETALDHIPDSRWGLIIPEQTTVEERVELVLTALAEAEEYERTKIYS